MFRGRSLRDISRVEGNLEVMKEDTLLITLGQILSFSHLFVQYLWDHCSALVLPLVSLILIVINVIIVASITSRSSSFIYIWRFTSFTKNTSFTKLSVRYIQMYSIYILYTYKQQGFQKLRGCSMVYSEPSTPCVVFCGKWKLYFILVMNLVSILGQTISSHL